MMGFANLFRRKSLVCPWEAVREALKLVRAAHPDTRVWFNGVNYQGAEIVVVPARPTNGHRAAQPSVFLATLFPLKQELRFPRYVSIWDIQMAMANADGLRAANDHVDVRGALLTNAPEADFVKIPHSLQALRVSEWTGESIADAMLDWIGTGS